MNNYEIIKKWKDELPNDLIRVDINRQSTVKKYFFRLIDLARKDEKQKFRQILHHEIKICGNIVVSNVLKKIITKKL